MMTPIIAAIILIMSARRHLLRLDAMHMTVGTTEHGRMSIVVRRGRFSVSFYPFVRYVKEYNEF
jgi:hypothetical protein